MRKPRFRLDPDLGDGYGYSIVDTPQQVAEAVRVWATERMKDHDTGFNVDEDTIEVTITLMTDEEVSKLPEH